MKKIIMAVVLGVFIINIMGCMKKNTVKPDYQFINISAEVNESFEYHGMLNMFQSGTGLFAKEDTIDYENPPKEGFVIRNNVEILTETDECSTVLGLLNLHDRIIILAEVRILQPDSFGDWSKNWYKINFNNIEGYIRTCCVDMQKYLFNVNRNIIVIYPRLANGMFDDRRHNPYYDYHRFPSHNIFINDKNIQLPESIIRGGLNGGKVIDGNLYLIYSYFFDEYDSPIIISTEGEKILIGTKDHRQYLTMEGDFIIDKDGMLYAYYGNGSNVIIPEQIAGINVKTLAQGVFWREDIQSISLPSSIRDIGINDRVHVIIIDSNVDLNVENSFSFVAAYNRNGKKGGIYTQNGNHIWTYKP
jgi:hypothetical protein